MIAPLQISRSSHRSTTAANTIKLGDHVGFAPRHVALAEEHAWSRKAGIVAGDFAALHASWSQGFIHHRHTPTAETTGPVMMGSVIIAVLVQIVRDRAGA